MESLLVISKGILHPPLQARLKLKKIIEGLGKYNIVYLNNFYTLKDLDLNQYSGIIAYYHIKENKENSDSISELINYVNNGGGVLFLHGTTASFKGNKDYNDMLGSRFINHGRITDIVVSGFVGFKVKDELYRHDLSTESEIVLKGNGVPVYWKKGHNKGRIACYTLGHRKVVFDHLETSAILKDALDYILKKDVKHENT